MGKRNHLFVGTSGYSYPHWSKGVFYPTGLKQRDWLGFYAGQFTTVELNVSFYRRPKLEFLRRWAAATGPEFVFAAKLNRMITHYQKLRNCGGTLADEKIVRDGLEGKLAVVLAQLPPSLPADPDLLKRFLDLTRSAPGRWIPRLAVEFRHESWLTDETYRLLNDYQAALCLADWGECHITRPSESPFLYVRRHSGQNHGDYSPAQIRADAAFLQPHLAAGKSVYVYYNNDLNGYAVKNAKELLTALAS